MATLATRGLALPLGLHAAWNLGDWARGGKGESGLWMTRVDDGYATGVEMVAMTGYAAIMLLALATFWVLYRRRTATTVQ
jgi:membrane protease YdiL (CAAX protease family)